VIEIRTVGVVIVAILTNNDELTSNENYFNSLTQILDKKTSF